MPSARRGRPWLSANFAMTWDGRISTRARTPADFSSPLDKRRLLEIRARADAIIVTALTAKIDRMTMGLPDAALRAAREQRGQVPYPLRVLLTNSGRLDLSCPVFEKTFSPIVIFSTTKMPKRTRLALESRATLHLDSGDRVDLRAMMITLHREHQVRRAHCEGGGTLLRSLLEAELLDELFLTLCPRIFGSAQAPTVTGPPGDFLPKSTVCKLVKLETVGGECFLQYRIRHEGSAPSSSFKVNMPPLSCLSS